MVSRLTRSDEVWALGLIHKGCASRFALRFACKPFDAVCVLCEHSSWQQQVPFAPFASFSRPVWTEPERQVLTSFIRAHWSGGWGCISCGSHGPGQRIHRLISWPEVALNQRSCSVWKAWRLKWKCPCVAVASMCPPMSPPQTRSTCEKAMLRVQYRDLRLNWKKEKQSKNISNSVNSN